MPTFPFNVVAANSFPSKGAESLCRIACVVVQASAFIPQTFPSAMLSQTLVRNLHPYTHDHSPAHHQSRSAPSPSPIPTLPCTFMWPSVALSPTQRLKTRQPNHRDNHSPPGSRATDRFLKFVQEVMRRFLLRPLRTALQRLHRAQDGRKRLFRRSHAENR